MGLTSIHWWHLAGKHVSRHSGVNARVPTQIPPVLILPVCSTSSTARLLTVSFILGLCQVASNSALQSILQSCLEQSCDTLNARSVIHYLSHVCEKSGSPIPTPLAEEDISSVSRDTVTATGLTRAHRNMARSMTSAPAATVTGITTTQVSDGSTIAGGNGSATTSSSTSSTSSSAARPKATQNGGTVLDQAGTTGASSTLQAGSLWSMSVGLGCLVGLAWLW